MGKMHDQYQLEITTLTPLHIGSGNNLLLDYDYVKHAGKTWVIDEDALAEAMFDPDLGSNQAILQGVPARDLLRSDDFRPDSPLFRYVMPGIPRATTPGSTVQELIKDSADRPYIPGSSLKGALRTALLYGDWAQEKRTYDLRDLNRNGKFAGQSLEKRALEGTHTGRNNFPNYDLMRALQVADSQPAEQDRLQLLNISVIVEGKEPGAPIEIEAIAPDTTFTTTLTLDGYLLSEYAKNKIGWSKEQERLLKKIPRLVNYWTLERLQADDRRGRGKLWRGWFNEIASYFVQEGKLANNEFIMQLGWGGGWDSKTFGSHLMQDTHQFTQLTEQYNVIRKGKYNPQYIFPKSRRVVMKDNQPRHTLGWVKVKMEKFES